MRGGGCGHETETIEERLHRFVGLGHPLVRANTLRLLLRLLRIATAAGALAAGGQPEATELGELAT